MVAALVCLSQLLRAETQQGASPAPAGNVQNGKALFLKNGCYECHGYAAQGGRDGARLAQTTMPLPAFVRYVRRPAGAMPAFTQKVLSDQDLSDIYAFLKSLPAAKPSADIPMLKNSRER